jgi:hypothetical protein
MFIFEYQISDYGKYTGTLRLDYLFPPVYYYRYTIRSNTNYYEEDKVLILLSSHILP